MALSPTRAAPTRLPASRLPSPNLAKAEEEAGRVSDSPSGNYILAHPQDEWQLTSDGELVPVIVALSKMPGVQGVDRRGGFGVAQAYYLERGYTLIPHDILPQDYVALYLNKRGQSVHRSVFQTPLDGPNGTVWTFDASSWRKFLRLLTARGIVRPPRPHILRGMLHSKRQEYDHLRPPSVEDASRREVYERRVAMLKRQLSCLEAEIERSVAEHGEQVSTSRDQISTLLDAALSEAEPDQAPEPDSTPPKPKARAKR